MSAEKRIFKDFDNKELFNYNIIKGVIHFGNIYNKQKSGNIRMWRLEIRLFDGDEQVRITKQLIKSMLNEDYYTIINRYSGLISDNAKITMTKDDIITSGKNIGKTNETTVLTQSIIQGRSDLLKKMNAGYVDDESGIKEDALPFPMALGDYSKHKNKLSYPIMMQPKIDGLRAIIYKKDGEVHISSRRRHDINGFSNLRSELKDILPNNIYLDGELYHHGYPLQKISGIVRNDNKNDDNTLQFWIFDMFNIKNPNMKFHERFDWIINNIKESNYIQIIDTVIIDNVKDSDSIYEKYLSDKYEGTVYKSMNKNYEFSFSKEVRSNYYLKRKPFFDEEYKIVDYDTDKNDAILFVLETENGKTFRSVPMGNIDERIELVKNINFKRDFYGKMATIRYDDKSSDGVPIRGRFVTIRDRSD